MKNSRLSPTKCYNKGQISLVIETSLKGYFVSYAKRYEKSSFFLRGNPSYPFRRNVVNSTFLQQDWIPSFTSEIYSEFIKKFQLPSFRTDLGFDICYHHRSSQNQQDRNPAIQWSFSGNAGAQAISGSIYPTPILETSASQKYPPIGQIARQSESLSVSSSSRANYTDLRFGFGSNHNLRKTGVSQSGIQPQKAWKAFLSSFALFRISFPRILAWKFKTRQYCKFHRSYSFYPSMFGQSTQEYCQIPYSVSNGYRILRKSNDSVSRRYRMWICNCIQAISQYQRKGICL